jgi:prephenate dehydrogenase
LRASIVGLGLMGGSLGLALRRAGWHVAGADREEAVVTRALELGAIDEAGRPAADVTVLAVPLLAMRAVLGEIEPGARVTDLCSTKVEVLRWAAEAGVGLVGGHPLCGSDRSGIDAARADLYWGAPWVLTGPDPVVEEMVVAAGAHPLNLDADAHDRLAAGVSHVAFLISSAYMLAAESSPEWPAMAALAASGFRDMTRLAGGDPEMYVGIAATNTANILARLDEFEVALGRLRLQLEDAQGARLAELLEEARAARRRWEETRSR